ncbi:MAG: GNAT family N-acetyltransferase [Oscillospiraceae bacterium]
MLKLVKLTPEMESEFKDYIAEWGNESIVPFSTNPNGRTYSELLDYIKSCENKETCPEGFVPDRTYALINETNRILGAVNLRLELNEYLLNFGGHIGYGIRPSERQKGYAKEQLKLTLPIAKSFGLDKVLITCDKENSGSSRTIVACGGVLEDERENKNENEITQRYWITI